MVVQLEGILYATATNIPTVLLGPDSKAVGYENQNIMQLFTQQNIYSEAFNKNSKNWRFFHFSSFLTGNEASLEKLKKKPLLRLK